MSEPGDDDELHQVVRRFTALSPARVEEVREDPTLLQKDSRQRIALIDRQLEVLALDPSTPVAMKLDIRREWRQTANITPVQSALAPGAGFSITINIPASGAVPATTVTASAAPQDVIDINDDLTAELGDG